MTVPAITLSGLSKSFGNSRALIDIDRQVRPGTIHALLGENGAGKTTLMSILYGLCKPDEGQIVLGDRSVSIPSPRRAMEMGIGMIHQHLMLVDNLTVAENVALGLRTQGIQLKLDDVAARLLELSSEYNFEIEPHQEIWKLPIGMRQRVEILKVLFREAEIIILDEPTSVLTPTEVNGFLDGLRRLKENGKTILFITHKLEEVEAVADSVTIIRRGRVCANFSVSKTTANEMARAMIGRDVSGNKTRDVEPGKGGIVLNADTLWANDSRGVSALKGVSLQIRAGEILGIAGVDGNGQAELASVIAGLHALVSGTVVMNGENITHCSAWKRRHLHRISYVPEDRHSVGLVLDMPVLQNAVMRDFGVRPFSRFGFLNKQKSHEIAQKWVNKYDVRLQNIHQNVRVLSGGNQQKLIFAREVECDPELLIVAQPCKGLDVGAIDAVQRTILKQRALGKAILYISTELEHILAVADRIAVMCAGEITGIVTPNEATDERIGALMGGVSTMRDAE